MSFVNKFKQANSNTNTLPQGVKLENTSFGQPNNTYTKPQFYPQQQPSTTHQKGKPRGGWDDEEDDEPGLAGLNQAKAPTFTPSQTANNVAKPVLLISTSNKVVEQPPQAGGQQQEVYKKFAVVPFDERFEQSHEYEVKVVDELIQPGGARLRQPDSVLNEFCKAAENFQVEVVGSILLNSLSCEGIWISKARAIFAIEALVKSIAKYYSYFKQNIKHLRRNEFENEGLNGSQLTKFLDDLIDYLEDPEKGFSSQMQQDIPVIVSSTEPNSSASPEEIPGKAYAQSAVYSTHPGLLTSQLASESAGIDSPTQETSTEQPKPAASFLSKFKKNAEAKAQAQVNTEQKNEENLLDSLAGLNFSEEVKPQQQEPEQPKKSNFDDVYNLYLNSGPQMNYGNMQYANMQNPNMNNMGYQQYQQYGNRVNGYNQQQQQQYYAQFAARQNQPQYYQGQRGYMASPVVPAEQPLSSEDYFKKKQQEENEKRFDNLKFGF